MFERVIVLSLALTVVSAIAGIGTGMGEALLGDTTSSTDNSLRAGQHHVGSQALAAAVAVVADFADVAMRMAARSAEHAPLRPALVVEGVQFVPPLHGRQAELAPGVLARVRDLQVYDASPQSWAGDNATVRRAANADGPMALRALHGTLFRFDADQANINFSKLSAILSLLDEDVRRMRTIEPYGGPKLFGYAWVRQEGGLTLAQRLEWIDGTSLLSARSRVAANKSPLENGGRVADRHIASAEKLADMLSRAEVYLDAIHGGNLMLTDDGVRLVDNGVVPKIDGTHAGTRMREHILTLRELQASTPALR